MPAWPARAAADLVIAAQRGVRWRPAPEVDTLLYEAGRPVLVMPHDAPCLSPFRRVIVAWNGSREAARATFDALPFILEAEADGNPVHRSARDADGARRRRRRYRRRPGAPWRQRHRSSRRKLATGSVDEVIADRLAATGADLLVLGAYSHSWLRELLFGGVTRTVVQAMPVATFLSR